MCKVCDREFPLDSQDILDIVVFAATSVGIAAREATDKVVEAFPTTLRPLALMAGLKALVDLSLEGFTPEEQAFVRTVVSKIRTHAAETQVAVEQQRDGLMQFMADLRNKTGPNEQ